MIRRYYHRFLCVLFGHEPFGPTNINFRWIHPPIYFRVMFQLESPTYICTRCVRPIKFAAKYPNGWIVVGEELM